MEKEKKEKSKQEKQKIYSSIFFFQDFYIWEGRNNSKTTKKNYAFHYNIEANQNYRLGSAKISVQWT